MKQFADLKRWQFTLIILFLMLGPAAAGAALRSLNEVAMIDSGSHHSCALTQEGGVICWGRNEDGQLGVGISGPPRSPAYVVGLGSGVLAIAAGGSHTCALTSTGVVKCWGANSRGQLGDGSTTRRLVPVSVSGLNSGVSAITAGGLHTCALTIAGGVKCWGSNDGGELGDGTQFTSRVTPVDVVSLSSVVVSVSAGGKHTCARTASGGAKCWGDNGFGRLGDGTNQTRPIPVDVVGLNSGILAISAGDAHTCALTIAGGAKCWGANQSGELGDGTTASRATAVDVLGLGSGATAISTGGSGGAGHTCALVGSNQAKCWGRNDSGQLGDGGMFSRLVAAFVLRLNDGATAISSGGEHSCAITGSDTVKCWGNNSSLQLGDPSGLNRLTGVEVLDLPTGVSAISAGGHSCALTAVGGAKCWGLNDGGQIGDGSTVSRKTPVDVIGLTSGLRSISAGVLHSCSLSNAGGVKCWGDTTAAFPEFDPLRSTRITPLDVVGLTEGVIDIGAGFWHGCALTTAGAVKCWGDNSDGQLGNGSIEFGRPYELLLTSVDAFFGVGGFLAISVGAFHNCVVTGDGRVGCWGRASEGQLGFDSNSSAPRPSALVSGLVVGEVVTVSAGYFHTCALTTVGGVKCWGRNSSGQLGDGSTSSRSIAADVVGLTSGVIAIDAGGSHTCALTTANEVKCWGENGNGQLGDGGTIDRHLPIAASGLTRDVSAISAGAQHTCAIATNGRARCWGSGEFGQIGDGGRNDALPGDVVFESFTTGSATDGNGRSLHTGTDASGRYLVFESDANTLVGGDTNGRRDIFRRDQQSRSTVRVSVDNAGAQISGDSVEPSVSADGRFVTFVAPSSAVSKLLNESPATAERRKASGGFSVFLRDLLTNTTQRIGTAHPSGLGSEPELAVNGTGVAWNAVNTNPAIGVIGQDNAFFVPLIASGNIVLPGAEQCLSCAVIGPTGKAIPFANGGSREVDVSADGRYAVFTTTARNLVPNAASPCSGASAEAILIDLISRTSQRVSPPTGVSQCGTIGASKPSIDEAGGKVAYESDAPLRPEDINQRSDIYLYTRISSATQRVSENLLGHEGLGNSTEPNISGDGTVVAFRSEAKNLEPREADNNEIEDIHVYRIDQPNMRRVSRNSRGDQADLTSRAPVLNYDGSLVAFDSDATNLIVDPNNGSLVDTNGVGDVFQVTNPTKQSDRVFASGFE